MVNERRTRFEAGIDKHNAVTAAEAGGQIAAQLRERDERIAGMELNDARYRFIRSWNRVGHWMVSEWDQAACRYKSLPQEGAIDAAIDAAMGDSPKPTNLSGAWTCKLCGFVGFWEGIRFDNVSCSQCGGDFGPRDHGYSHCIDHHIRDQAFMVTVATDAMRICLGMLPLQHDHEDIARYITARATIDASLKRAGGEETV